MWCRCEIVYGAVRVLLQSCDSEVVTISAGGLNCDQEQQQDQLPPQQQPHQQPATSSSQQPATLKQLKHQVELLQAHTSHLEEQAGHFRSTTSALMQNLLHYENGLYTASESISCDGVFPKSLLNLCYLNYPLLPLCFWFSG